MAGGGTVTVKIVGDSSGLKGALDDAGDSLGGFGKKLGVGIGVAAAAGGAALVGFGVKAVEAFSESQKVAAQTEAVLKSTGGAAKVTADHVGDLAGQLSMLSGTDDEVIQSGENLLLTFTNIQNKAGKGNDIFDQATKTMLDMSTALGQDTASSAVQLGKALNDPIKGVTALQRVGVSFTEAQKDQIKTLVDSGKTMDAQKLILGELQKEFGGSAKAAGETFAGQLNKAKVIVGNFMEDVGGKLAPILLNLAHTIIDNVAPVVREIAERFDLWRSGGIDLAGAIAGLISDDLRFLPVIQRIIDAVKDLWNWISNNLVPIFQKVADFVSGNMTPVLVALGVIVGAVLLSAVVALGAAIAALMSPIVLIVGGLALLAAGLTYAYQNSQTFRNAVQQVWQVVQAAFGAIQAIISTAVDFIRGVWRVFGDDLMSFAREAWAGIQEIVRGALEILKGIFDLIKAVLTGKWGDAWNALKAIIDGVWDTIFAVVRQAVTNVIPTIIAGAGQLIASAARTAFDGLKAPFVAVLNWIIDKWNSIKFTVPSLDVGPVHIGGQTIGVPQIPRFHTGGLVPGAPGSETLALLQAGERVIPADQSGGLTVVNNFYGPIDSASAAREIQQLLLQEKRRSGALGLA